MLPLDQYCGRSRDRDVARCLLLGPGSPAPLEFRVSTARIVPDELDRAVHGALSAIEGPFYPNISR